MISQRIAGYPHGLVKAKETSKTYLGLIKKVTTYDHLVKGRNGLLAN